MNFIIVFIVIHGNTIHNAVVDGIFLFCKNVFYLLVQQNYPPGYACLFLLYR